MLFDVTSHPSFGALLGLPARFRQIVANRLMRASLLLLVFFAALSAPYRANAQDFRASITGEVSDPTGAVIPNATVTALNVETHVTYSAKTDSRGIYSVLYILPGTYTVAVTADGFQKMVYDKVILDSSQKLGLNVPLATGRVEQQIVVTAGSVDLDTVSASTGGVIDQTKVDNMPSSGLMVWDDVALTQGVRSTSASAFNLTPRNNSNKYTVAGAPTDENAYFMNGAPVSDRGSWYFSPNTGAVQQAQAGVMPYDSQYGRTGGGTFATNVKDGTNALHGQAYLYFGHRLLNANEWASNLAQLPRPDNTRETWGANLGGPIFKDKTFYFASYEAFHQSAPSVVRDSFPTAAELTGDFSATGYAIYDPLSTFCSVKNANGTCKTYSRKQFPNNIIPQNRLSTIGQAILALYPAPTVTCPSNPASCLSNNFVQIGAWQPAYQQYIGRIDHNLSQKTRIYGLFTFEHDWSLSAGNNFANAGNTGTLNNSNYYDGILDVTHIFSSRLVLDLKTSYGHSSGLSTNGNALQKNFQANKLGLTMPFVGTTSQQGIAPQIAVSGFTGAIGNTSNGTADVIADTSGSLTQILGRHSLHYGGEFMDIQTAPTGTLGNPHGSFTFNAGFTQQDPVNAKTGQGNSFASLLLGYPGSGSVTWTLPTFVTLHYYGAYLQDDYKVRPNLTLNLGLRWDVNKSPRDRHNRINAGFCLTCVNPYDGMVSHASVPALVGGFQFAGVNGMSDTPFTVHWTNWQPRIGFAFAPRTDLVIRGGYGIYYPWATTDVDTAGFSQTTSFIASLDGNLTPDNYFNSGTPYPKDPVTGMDVSRPTGSSLGLQTNAGTGITFNDPDRKLRMTQHWSLGIQQRLPAGFLMDLQYLGTTVHGIPMTRNLGVISESLRQACFLNNAVCNTRVTNPFYGVLPSNVTLGASSTIQSWQLQRAFPLFNGVSEARVPAGSSHYNAGSLRIERRVRTLNMIFNYTYSNWMDRDNYLNSGSFQDLDLVNSLDDNDRRHYISMNVVYPLPNTPWHGFVGGVLNRWLLSSTVLWGTGTPLNLPSADFRCTSYMPAGGQTRAHWFNNDSSCWTQLVAYERRTTPLSIGILRDPGILQWNPAISKRFGLTHDTYFQLRAEAINGANHPNFGGASTDITKLTTFTPATSWTGFGTLPTSSNTNPRQIFISGKFVF